MKGITNETDWVIGLVPAQITMLDKIRDRTIERFQERDDKLKDAILLTLQIGADQMEARAAFGPKRQKEFGLWRVVEFMGRSKTDLKFAAQLFEKYQLDSNRIVDEAGSIGNAIRLLSAPPEVEETVKKAIAKGDVPTTREVDQLKREAKDIASREAGSDIIGAERMEIEEKNKPKPTVDDLVELVTGEKKGALSRGGLGHDANPKAKTNPAHEKTNPADMALQKIRHCPDADERLDRLWELKHIIDDHQQAYAFLGLEMPEGTEQYELHPKWLINITIDHIRTTAGGEEAERMEELFALIEEEYA